MTDTCSITELQHKGAFSRDSQNKGLGLGLRIPELLMTVILLVGGLSVSFFCYLPVTAFCHEVQLAATLLSGHVPGHQGCITVL